MIPMTLQQAAYSTGGKVLGNRVDSTVVFSTVATDSRKLMPDSLFIAIRGERFNGHEYLDKAIIQGAVACLLDETTKTSIPVIKVNNTVMAMGQLAKAVCSQISPACVGITGSCGKTTVKEMVASILQLKGKVLATKGNFNNAIGVPLTLFRLASDDQFAVLELGASKPGDIKEIAQLISPDVAIITNVSQTHLQGLGSIEGVARVKGELLDYLQDEGTAILEQDSHWLTQWKNQLTDKQTLVTFSLIDNTADYYALKINNHNTEDCTVSVADENKGSSFLAMTPLGEVNIQLPVPGKHNVKNALAAMAAAITLGADLSDCQQGLASLAPMGGRLKIISGINGSRIIDDSYNSNPASLTAAMDVLVTFSGNKILVMGDMAELGDMAESAHQQAGQQVKAMGIDAIYATGTLSKITVEEFGAGALHFDTRELLTEALIDKINSRWTLLIKGSRSAEMEKIVETLCTEGSKNQQQEGAR